MMIKRYFSLIMIAFSQLAFAGTSQLVVSLSLPGEPGTLNIDHVKGKVKISGYSGEVVIINATIRDEGADTERTGLTKVTEQSIQLNATEKDNLVTVFSNSQLRIIDLDINVPVHFDLRINNKEDGNIEIYNIAGELELNNETGDIVLNNVYGPAVISTVDGKIEARFQGTPIDQPMAFTSVNGKIDIRFPKDTPAHLKMKSEFGEIYTDFNINIEQRKTVTEKSETTGISRISLDEWTYATINGGGPQIMIKSYHGDIFIQQEGSGVRN